MIDTVTIYEYSKCSTCRKALKYLDANNINYNKIPIVDQPPTEKELETALARLGGDLRLLFNTSGIQYREMKLSKKIKTMDIKEGIALLSNNGKLVKRPFVLTKSNALVGFKEEVWDEIFKC